jgi:hypothetical protein
MKNKEASVDEEEWLTSKETKTSLKISSCDLMHLRESGQLRFRKIRSAFFYAKADVDRICIHIKNP